MIQVNLIKKVRLKKHIELRKIFPKYTKFIISSQYDINLNLSLVTSKPRKNLYNILIYLK